MRHHHRQALVSAARVFLIAAVMALGISLYLTGTTFMALGFMSGAASGAVSWVGSHEDEEQDKQQELTDLMLKK